MQDFIPPRWPKLKDSINLGLPPEPPHPEFKRAISLVRDDIYQRIEHWQGLLDQHLTEPEQKLRDSMIEELIYMWHHIRGFK